MKRFLSIPLLLVLIGTLLVVATTAAEADTYWSISADCLVKARILDDGTVPTFKKVESSAGVYEGLIVGLPTTATVGDDFFEAKDGYNISYYDSMEEELASNAHLGTTDKIVVYNENNQVVAEYGIVTYGDADGDGVFDIIDIAISALCLNGLMDSSDSPAVYEAVKPRAGVDNEYVQAEDYQQIVNDSIKDESELEENLKGRKIPVDETLSFESVIYTNNGATRTAAVTAADSNFKNIITINYNGSATAPSASGIYAITATVPESEKYLVTAGERNLGFLVIAPKAATGYKVTADNSNKKITIGTTDNDTSNSTLAAEFEKWLNSSYTLNIGGTVNPATVASALPNRSFEVYTGQKTTLVKTGNTAVLGSYLPDDNTLWANNTASNSKTVTLSKGDVSFAFNLYFQQDAATVEAAKRAYFMDCADAARGQRTDWTSTTSNGVVSNIKEDVKSVNLFVKMKNGYPCARVAVKNSSATCYDALSGTGVKGVLVGRSDSVAIQASSTNDFTGKTIESLFEDNGYRYSQYSGTDMTNCVPIMNSVLSGLNISIPTNLISLYFYKVSNFVGKTGYCNYLCNGLNTNIRYNTVFYLEFSNFASSGEDASRTITTNTTTNGTITVNPTNQHLHTKVYEHTIMNAGEPVVVTATPATGYKLKSLTVTKSDGTLVDIASDGYFLMPDSNITINAEFEAK